MHLNNDYIANIDRLDFTDKKFTILQFGIENYYTSTYRYAKSDQGYWYKRLYLLAFNELFDKTVNSDDFDWHHVVEMNHVRKIRPIGDIYQQKWHAMPTILTPTFAHAPFTTQLENEKFSDVRQEAQVLLKFKESLLRSYKPSYFTKKNPYAIYERLTIDKPDFKKSPIELVQTVDGLTLLEQRIFYFRQLYNDVYAERPLLSRIANNVFDTNLKLARAISVNYTKKNKKS